MKVLTETQTSYDRIAEEYARQIYGELAGKPMDRQVLDRFAERLRGRGVVCDMGCGPGQMSDWLGAAGYAVEEIIEREPYAPEVEHQSRRAYVLAKKWDE